MTTPTDRRPAQADELIDFLVREVLGGSLKGGQFAKALTQLQRVAPALATPPDATDVAPAWYRAEALWHLCQFQALSGQPGAGDARAHLVSAGVAAEKSGHEQTQRSVAALRATWLAQHGQPEEALEQLAQLVAAGIDPAGLLSSQVAALLADRDLFDQAQRVFAAALERARDHADAWTLALVLTRRAKHLWLRMGDRTAAETDLAEAERHYHRGQPQR